MNAIDYAIHMETEGERLFERLEHDVADRDMKGLFGLLKKEELEHIRNLEGMRKELDSRAMNSAMLGRMAGMKSGFDRLLRNGTLQHELRMDGDAFWHFVRAEEETIRVLEGVAKTERRSATRELLMEIVDEEKRHLETMEEIYDFMEAPRTYLEWGEFSNLRTL